MSFAEIIRAQTEIPCVYFKDESGNNHSMEVMSPRRQFMLEKVVTLASRPDIEFTAAHYQVSESFINEVISRHQELARIENRLSPRHPEAIELREKFSKLEKAYLSIFGSFPDYYPSCSSR